MSQLAIKGHADRGEEVIKLLISLGGKNPNCNVGKYINSIYFINHNGYIEATSNPLIMLDFTVLTLEEVEALMPYQIGDKVLYEDKMYEITGMKWHKYIEKIVYDAKGEKSTLSIFDPDKFTPVVNNEEFQNKLLKIYPDGKTGHIQLIPHEDYEIKEINGDFVMIKKQPKHPTTYKDYCSFLGIDDKNCVVGHMALKLEALQRLLICRDAYWKIAGEEMGLDKPWEPNITDVVFTIMRIEGIVVSTGEMYGQSSILEFPTEEMRDAFYENFKDLIEECKELL